MSTNELPGRELSAWKQIAAYLHVTERTAQLWEKNRKLPVLRDGSGRVFARANDLDEWLKVSAVRTAWFDRVGPLRSLAATLAALLFGTWGWFAVRSMTQSVVQVESLKVQDGDLVAFDGTKREIWRHRFEKPARDALYEDVWAARSIWLGDLEGKGEKVVLFVHRPMALDAGYQERTDMYCLSASGQVRWKFEPGRVLTHDETLNNQRYNTWEVLVIPSGNGRPARVMVSSQHSPYYANQVAILNTDGKMIGEYWHSGGLIAHALADPDRDGRPDLIVAGVNNGYGQATLIVLDPENTHGSSTELKRPEVQIGEAGKGTEKLRLLFPRSSMNLQASRYNWVESVWVAPTDITVAVQESREKVGFRVWYHFDTQLRFKTAGPDDEFRAVFKKMRLEHQMDHDLDAEENRFLKIQCLVDRLNICRAGELAYLTAMPANVTP